MASIDLPNIEKMIFSGILNRESFTRKVLPYVKPEYFQSRAAQILYSSINKFFIKYNELPGTDTMRITIGNDPTLTEEEVSSISDWLEDAGKASLGKSEEWMVEETEKWCKNQAVHNAIMASIKIIGGTDTAKRTQDCIPELLKDALAVNFDTAIGHEYLEMADNRYDECHAIIERVPFGVEMLNTITKGGLPRKTLTCILAGTGVGKSLFMCDYAANALRNGKNVLYITLEMADIRIAERIDANLMDIPITNLETMPRDKYLAHMSRIKNKVTGRLFIKEYPTAAGHVGHFRHLMDELRLKKNFKADVICIDYINICASSRIKLGGNSVNSYTYIKSIAEELRGLAVEYNLPILTATQTNRSGFNDSDMDLTNTSESFGLPATVDLMFGLITTQELADSNQLLVKQLKNRFNPVDVNRKFVIGVDKSKMKLYDADASGGQPYRTAGKQQASYVPESQNRQPSEPQIQPVAMSTRLGNVFDKKKTATMKFNKVEEDE